MKLYDIAIIGGGIVGAATFYKLTKKYTNLRIILIEKEKEFAAHQTSHNSGVIHSGLYYKPGSKKAINCNKGRKELVEFCKTNNIKHDICGKIVVATDKSELSYLDKIYNTGIENGIENIKMISKEEIKHYEPFCEGIKGIHVPVTSIVDFVGATNKMIELGIENNSNSRYILNEEVIGILNSNSEKKITTSKNVYMAKNIIFCGGLQADRLAKKDGVKLKEKIVGFRGDYYELTERAKHKIKNLIYPVPNPNFPFLGVHFTRMINGKIECGPNAVFTFKREGYKKTDFSLTDTIDALLYKGTWKLFFKNFNYGINEYRRAFSKKLFLKTLQRLVPSLTMDDIKPSRSSGVRALLLKEDGDTKDDFRIEFYNNSIHVLNAPSPAATSCLAIGNDILEMAENYFNLNS